MTDITVSEINTDMEYLVRQGHTLIEHHETGTIKVWIEDGVYQYEDDCNGYRETYTDWEELVHDIAEGDEE